MCRLAAYLGKPIKLSQFLLKPEHSLVQQSWAPKEMQTGTLNADGFGFAWLAGDGTPCRYKNTMPIWSDPNLKSLGHSLSSPLWLANVRSATPGQGISDTNTQPFIKDNIIFTHNGCLTPFTKNEKVRLLDSLSNSIRAEINGDTDSLYLFALLQQHLLTKKSTLPSAIIGMMADLKTICHHPISGLLNIIVSDGDLLYACRHALNAKCPSLYYLQGKDNLKIASEPLTPTDKWLPFPTHSLMSFSNTDLLDSHTL